MADEENEGKKSFRRPREERGQKIGVTKFDKNEKERLEKCLEEVMQLCLN